MACGFLIVVTSLTHMALGTQTSVVVACRLSSCDSRAPQHRLSSCGARAYFLHSMWDLPAPALKPVSPTLAGGFLTTVPPGKSRLYYFIYKTKWSRRPLRWKRSKMWRSPSSPQIHQKYIYVWNNSYRTPTERWQKTSDFPKGSCCSGQVSGLSLWGERDEFRTLDHQRPPGPM